MTLDIDKLNEKTVQIGREIFDWIHQRRDSVTTMNKWTRELMEWCLSNPDVKGRVLRFVDVLPSLKTDRAIIDHIRDYFSPTESRLPLVLRGGSIITRTPFTGRAVANFTRHMTQEVARQFICGETIEEAIKKLAELENGHMAATLDILGEAILSDTEATLHQNRILDLIKKLPPYKNISIKLSGLSCHFDPLAFDRAISDVVGRLIPILRAAKLKNIFINIDAEHYHTRDLTLEIFRRVLVHPDVKGYPHIGLVFQAYLKDSEQKITNLIHWLRKNNHTVTLRLVKGAYWDSEVATARTNGWPIPVFLEKEETDANFEKLTILLMENRDAIRVAIGSHNIRSIAHALSLHESSSFPIQSLEFQLLYGMADPIKRCLVDRGYTVRVYAPFGPLIPGMAYLVRRILENTSNESFLKLDWTHEAAEKELLTPPRFSTNGENQDSPPGSPQSPARDTAPFLFTNEPSLDFSKEEIRMKFQASIKNVEKKLGRHYRLTLNGKKEESSSHVPSKNPANPDQLIGIVYRGEWKEAEEAIRRARDEQPEWTAKPAEERAEFLFRAANIMRELRMELAAWEILEAGKTWREADADVTEAIDFLKYYGRAMIYLESHETIFQVPGEKNKLATRGRGVVAIIAPWNFPLAIITGMTSAALVAGNAALVKPAENTGVLGSLFVDILLEAGIPPGILAFLPGSGSEIGRGMVGHPLIDMVAFTGSKDVGLSIIQQAARTTKEQPNIKKVIAEMGGKNAIIVDSDADFDEAIQGVLTSAFGYQGQKCSACSRIILLDDIYHPFINRLIEAVKSLKMGDPRDPATDIGPVIDLDAFNKINGIIEGGKLEARLLYQGEVPSHLKNGFFIPPTIFSDPPYSGLLALEEIFGPVLSVFRVRNFQEAILVANNTEFALTAGVYSRNLSHLDEIKRNIEAGNIYINRKITGAMVGRQPFGGYRMSGLGSKTGGLDYLNHFHHQISISENTFRHGFPI